MKLGSRSAFVAVLLVGVAGTGLVVRLLNEVGYSTLGSAVWVVGYGGTIAVLWYGWLRPLDLSGADTADSTDTTDATRHGETSDTE